MEFIEEGQVGHKDITGGGREGGGGVVVEYVCKKGDMVRKKKWGR